MYRVKASDGRIVGNNLTQEEAEKVVQMHRNGTTGGPMKADRSNASEDAKLTYTVEQA